MTDLTNKRFGRLTVVKQDSYHVFPSGKRKIKWLCQCDCGNKISVIASDLNNSHTRSCGCLRRETTKALKLSHNKCQTRLYSIWQGMKNRCYNKKQSNYQYYGGKHITICREWLDSFETFYQWAINNGYNTNMTLDRINVNGEYSPHNCRWVTTKEQALNRTHNRRIEYNGKSQSLKEWSDETGIAYSCLFYRLNAGWNIADALTIPSRKHTSTEITQ